MSRSQQSVVAPIRGDTHVRHVRFTHEADTIDSSPAMLDTIWEDVHREGHLHLSVLHALRHVLHISHSTKVQTEVLPLFRLPGHSIFVEAHTGSGKTLAFVLPIIERMIRYNAAYEEATMSQEGSGAEPQPYRTRAVHAIMLAPTRELARQTGIVVRTLLGTLPYGLKCHIHAPTTSSSQALSSSGMQRRRKGVQKQQRREIEERRGNKRKDAKFNYYANSSSDEEEASGKERESAANLSSLNNMGPKCGGYILCTTPRDLHESLTQHVTPDTFQVLGGAWESTQKKTPLIITTSKGVQKKDARCCSPPLTVVNGDPQGLDRLVLVLDEADVILEKYHGSFEGIVETLGQKFGCPWHTIDLGLFGATLLQSPRTRSFYETTQQRALRPEEVAAGAKRVSQWSMVKTLNDKEAMSNLSNRFVWCSFGAPLLNPTQPVTKAKDIRYQLGASGEGGSYCSVVDDTAARVSYLVHLLNMHRSQRHLVFCNTDEGVIMVTAYLKYFHLSHLLHYGTHQLFSIHGGIPEAIKHARYKAFLNLPACSGGSNSSGKQTGVASSEGCVLICTNRAAHGLDIRDVRYVIHYDAPDDTRTYIHRVGRTARMGMQGTNVVLLCPSTSDSTVDQEAHLDRVKQQVDTMKQAIDISEWHIFNVVTLVLPSHDLLQQLLHDPVASHIVGVPQQKCGNGNAPSKQKKDRTALTATKQRK